MSKAKILALASVLLLSLSASPVARAYSEQDVNADLARHLTNVIEGAVQDEQNVVRDAADSTSDSTSNSNWDLSRIWLRLRPKAIFSVGVAKLEISPDVEMLWKK